MKAKEYIELGWTPKARGAAAVVLQRLVRRPSDDEVDAICLRIDIGEGVGWPDLKVLLRAAVHKMADDLYWWLVLKRQMKKLATTKGIELLRDQCAKAGWKEWQDGKKLILYGDGRRIEIVQTPNDQAEARLPDSAASATQKGDE